MYTPDDGDYWMLAKLNVQVTDLGYAQIVEHLAKVFLNTTKSKNLGCNRDDQTRFCDVVPRR